MEKMMKDDKHSSKTYQKNIDDWKLLLLNKHFAEDVRVILSGYDLPILVDHIRDPSERFLKAYDILVSERLPRASYDALKLMFPEMDSYLDSRRIEELIKLQKEAAVECDVPEEAQRVPDHAEGRMKLSDVDWTLPIQASLMTNNMALVGLALTFPKIQANLPPTFKVSERWTVTRKDFLVVYLASNIFQFLHTRFVARIGSLARKTKPGRRWFYPLLYYVLTGRDPCEDGFILRYNIIISKNAEGNFIFEETPETRKRGVLEARKDTQRLKGKRSKHNRLRPKQNRDLKIHALSERKKDDRIKYKEIEEDFERDDDIAAERHLETLCIDDDVIAREIFGKRRSSRKTAKRQRQKIPKARSRLNKLIEEMYPSSP